LFDEYVRIVSMSVAPVTPSSTFGYLASSTGSSGRGGLRINDGTSWYYINTIATGSAW